MARKKNQISPNSLRNFTFGVEDSLASTVGLLSGVASAHNPSSTIILTGLILVFTEALSMGVGSFLSDQSALSMQHHKDVPTKSSMSGAFIMFFSYIFSGLIPIFPYTILPVPQALVLSVIFTLLALIILGVINAAISHTSIFKQAIRMLVLGGSVTLCGVLIGALLKK